MIFLQTECNIVPTSHSNKSNRTCGISVSHSSYVLDNVISEQLLKL